MFGSLGGPEVLFIFVLALLLFGPRKLPEIGRAFGRTLAEFRKATNDFRQSLEREIDVEEMRETRAGLEAAASEAREAARDAARAARTPPAIPAGSTPVPERRGSGPTETKPSEESAHDADDPSLPPPAHAPSSD